jgi:DNA (cytosine-5)-methyltransferase 1
MVKKYKLIDLFAGTGAFSYTGLKTNRIKPIYANDMVESSKCIYEHNMKHNLVLSDIHDIDPNNIPDADILTAGFPCQPFSLAGKRLEFKDTRSNVFYKLVEIMQKNNPE